MARIKEDSVIATEDGRLMLTANIAQLLIGYVADVLVVVGLFFGTFIVLGDRFFFTGAKLVFGGVGLWLLLVLAYGFICFHGWTFGGLVTGTRKVRELSGKAPGPFRMAWHALVVYVFFALLIFGAVSSGSGTSSGGPKESSLKRRIAVIRPFVSQEEILQWYRQEGKVPPTGPRKLQPKA
ncbi:MULTISPECIES: hypothetical protein [Arthrobacter]|uniref:RDD family protein n=2 Tax=Arthrobacter TaxID=1663 RepID=A0ABU9KIQ9_9MICC|nr:hypothetical protein [Arthrobacter sp. YJM1]MDP5226982.1 hypothetical protein [Arthrobacter sp. YJM1]